jgi:hypothetical protein
MVSQRKGTRAIPQTKPQARGCLTCGEGGGQGRGRTADLPIFRPSLKAHALGVELLAPTPAYPPHGPVRFLLARGHGSRDSSLQPDHLDGPQGVDPGGLCRASAARKAGSCSAPTARRRSPGGLHQQTATRRPRAGWACSAAPGALVRVELPSVRPHRQAVTDGAVRSDAVSSPSTAAFRMRTTRARHERWAWLRAGKPDGDGRVVDSGHCPTLARHQRKGARGHPQTNQQA